MQNTNTLSLQGAPVAAWQLPGGRMAQLVNRVMGGVFQLDRISGMYRDIQMQDEALPFVDRALTSLDVDYEIVHGALESIPKEGPLLVVANHPFGGVEGLVMLSLLMAARPDVKVMATHLLSGIPEFHRNMIFVDNFGGGEAATKNVAPLRRSLRWLKSGGVVGLFPAGEVAHFDLAPGCVRESDWRQTVAHLVRHSGATVLPLFFEGSNGPLFHAAGLVHPRLRTALLARELVNKAGHSIKVCIGHAIPFEKTNPIEDDGELTRYLRMRVLLLGAVRAATLRRPPQKFHVPRQEPVLCPGPVKRLVQEVAWLPPEQELVASGDYKVLIAEAKQIPAVLREITRLREVTFRAVGEGTGRSLDTDVFDQFYQHLFVWNSKASEVVGAYRLGMTDKIVPQLGVRGLYTSTLFKYNWELIGALHPAIEIGRSFVRQEYQRKHLPLLLLWKGIGRFVAMNPKYRNLFGTVSMSSRYAEVSRHLVADFFDQEKPHELAHKAVCPRNPMRRKSPSLYDSKGRACRIPDLESLSEIVGEIEGDGRGVPVLMRQYMKLGGRVLACNVDPQFNMALDALLVVDLVRTDPRLLELYMGDLASAYLDHHRMEKEAVCA